MFNTKQYCKGWAAGLLLLAAGSAQAIPVTYNFTITGTVDVLGTKTVVVTDSSGTTSTTSTEPNAFGLNAGDTITAFGTFTADLGGIGNETGIVYFDLAAFTSSGNTLNIDTNGTNNIQLLASEDTSYLSGGGPYLAFSNGALTDFDYLKSTAAKFNSSFMNFDDMTSSTSTTTTGKGNNQVTTTTTYESMLGTWNSAVITPIPEADTYVMMLAGLGLVGFMARARRRAMRISQA